MLRWFLFFSRWPLWALHALGSLGGWAAWLFSGRYRRRFLDNARQAGLGRRAVMGAVGQAGRMSAELPRLWLGRTPPLLWADDRAAAQAYAQGQGVLFLTPHMGCFEITAQALALRFGQQHGQLTVLYRPARQVALNEVMALARNRPGLRAVPTTLAGVRQMIKALRAGEAVGLLPDQVPPEGMGAWAPFFGRPAYTMTMAAKLVAQTGCAVVLLRGERLGWRARRAQGCSYVVHASRVAPQTEALLAAGDAAESAAAINRLMEDLIMQAPEQYLWGYNRYKGPRAEILTSASKSEEAA